MILINFAIIINLMISPSSTLGFFLLFIVQKPGF